MEELASLLDYQEAINSQPQISQIIGYKLRSLRTYDELKQRLFYTNLELESVRSQASQEMCKHKENVNQLLQLLKNVFRERDEALDQIKKILNNFPSFNTQTRTINQIQIQASKANSSITESNSFSETYNYQSPNELFFDMVSSSDSSNFAYLNYHQQQQQQQSPIVVDKGSLAIDTLVKGKTLPQKGKLLQAVTEAGPLLKTLLLAGPLPMWRNPPPVQGFHIPPISILGGDSEIRNYSNNPFVGVQVNDNGLLGRRRKLH